MLSWGPNETSQDRLVRAWPGLRERSEVDVACDGQDAAGMHRSHDAAGTGRLIVWISRTIIGTMADGHLVRWPGRHRLAGMAGMAGYRKTCQHQQDHRRQRQPSADIRQGRQGLTVAAMASDHLPHGLAQAPQRR